MSGATKAGFIGIIAVALMLPGVFLGVARGAEPPIPIQKNLQPMTQPMTRPMTQPIMKIKGSLIKTGEVRMEKIHIQLDMRSKEAIANPHDAVKKLLEQNGIPVNSLKINLQSLMRNNGGTNCYHVVLPEAEKSNTICPD